MKHLCSLVCALGVSCAAFCEDMPAPQDAQPLPIQSIPSTPIAQTPKVALKIEPLSQEQMQAGITSDILQSLVQKKLEETGVTIDQSIQQPNLILRVRSIQTGLDIATFFQLSLQEDSMLVRNRSLFQAITWSQASLLACRPEDLKKEILETVEMMAQAFAKDYNKALQM